MFIEDIKTDFYDVLLGNRVLFLVHYDVDAICACKILQELFKCDNIAYSLVPVGGISELKTAYEENCEEIKYVVLLNCGGTIDIVDILQPDEDVVFFVLDSHKPTDVSNVYSDGQVRLVYKDSDENIPNFEDIFSDNEEEEETEDSTGPEGLEAVVEKNRKRRAWENRRHTLLFNYTQFSYYGKPSALVCEEISWRVSRGGSGVWWAAGVATTAAREFGQRTDPQTLLDAAPLISRLAAGTASQNCQGARVVVEKDVCLPLYRLWSLEAALRHSPVMAPKLRLHALAGDSRLRQLLADMGFPLQQARQAYRSMDVELRRSLLETLETAAERLRLPSVARESFLLQAPHCPTQAALDLVYIIMALIDNDTMSRGEGFQQALEALSVEGGENKARVLGTEAAKRALRAVASLVNSTLSGKRLRLAGPFTYFIVPEGSAEAAMVQSDSWLRLAARWLAACGASPRPVVASTPAPRDSCLLIGLPPRQDDNTGNLFGAAFEQAASRSGASVSLDFFDSSVVTLPIAQRAQFLDALTALLS